MKESQGNELTVKDVLIQCEIDGDKGKKNNQHPFPCFYYSITARYQGFLHFCSKTKKYSDSSEAIAILYLTILEIMIRGLRFPQPLLQRYPRFQRWERYSLS